MYLFDNTYNGLISFLTGYFIAVMQYSEEDWSGDFQNWLRNKAGNHFSIHWSGYILSEMSANDEVLARNNLLDLFDEFLNSKS